MKLDVIKLDGKAAGSIDLGDDIFGLEPRVDILHRVVRWQRNNAQAGSLETGVDLAGDVAPRGIRLDDGKGSFEGHGDSFAFHIAASSGSAIQ